MESGETTTLIWFARAVQGAVVALAALAAARRRDWWPFSHYPMFAGRAEARAVRYFRARFSRPDGSRLGLTGLADPLADPFHRRCDTLWPEEGAPDIAAAREAMIALWREACALEPALGEAVAIEVVVAVGTLEANGELRCEETVALAIALEPTAQTP